MDKEHLHLLINEAIYLIPTEHGDSGKTEADALEDKTKTENLESEKILEEKKAGTIDEEYPSTPAEPTIDPELSPLSLAIFHESTSEADIQLLQKIISACKLETDSFEVFANGFNKEVKFEKALVFVEKSKAFYEPISYQDGQILCSKPLHQIAVNQGEKAKLWAALQKFV